MIGVLTQEGQTVVATQIAPVILELARLDAMTIRTQFSEADVIHIAVGHPVSFIIMGDPDTRYAGTLRAVEPAPKQPSSCCETGQSATCSTIGTERHAEDAPRQQSLRDHAD